MNTTTRRGRLEQLLELAQAYRGWGRKELARALGRDTTRLVPQSGLPKLDLLMELSRALDWPIEVVARHLRDESAGEFGKNGDPLLDELDAERGRDAGSLPLRPARTTTPATAEERALTHLREASGWARSGHHLHALHATRRGLEESGAPADTRLLIQTELAGHYLALWQLLEARSMAHDILQRWDRRSTDDQNMRAIETAAHAVRGNSNRRLLTIETADQVLCATLAREDLTRSRDLALELEETAGPATAEGERLRGDANTSLGGIIEAEVVLGRCTPAEALDRFANGVDAVLRCAESRSGPTPANDETPDGDTTVPALSLLRSAGWWCVYACNVVLRHLDDERAVQEQLGLFIDHARGIADRLDDWPLRERVMTMDDERRRRFMSWTSVEPECTLDCEGIRSITGIMGRFPRFQPTGWRILTAARIVVDNQVQRSVRRSTCGPVCGLDGGGVSSPP